jgi:REP element-mobilizing transposase RayT
MQIAASIRSRGYLPHWEKESAIYFVTFRLADSLPHEFIERLRQAHRVLKRTNQIDIASERKRDTNLRGLLQTAERLLDKGTGSCHLRDSRIAKIVAAAIQQFDLQRYRLFAWCVMPNHVHALFSPLSPHRLESILHTWKSYSSHQANRFLGRSGRLWQREYFDHLVRNEASFMKCVHYIEQNPHKAGLEKWPWVSCFGSAGVSPANSFSRRPEASATK